MKTNRPVNLDLLSIKFPVPAIASILHRISGVAIFVLIPVLLYALQESLASAERFDAVVNGFLGGLVGGGLMFLVLAGLIYHLIAGCKHLIMDMGIGETLEGGRLLAWLVLGLSAVFIPLALLWLL